MIPPIAKSEDLPERLAQRLQLPLPGRSAWRTMEPELSFGRYCGPPRSDARPAAVVVLLHWVEGRWHVPLMVRPETLSHHAWQIGLPGGIVEPGESSEEAALRELEEELGISHLGVMVLGQLSQLYLFGTNFLINPWVAVVRGALNFAPSAAEVQEVLQVPLDQFLEPANRGTHVEERGMVRFAAPHFSYGTARIWGATSMILAELAAVINELTFDDRASATLSAEMGAA